MKFLYDLFPVALFFVAIQIWDIFVATAVAIGATIVQVGWLLVRRKKVQPMLWASLAIIVLSVIAGVAAATVTSIPALEDPASFLGLTALLGLAVALVARIDWTRQRRDVLVVAVTMLAGGAAARLGLGWTGELVRLARGHALWLIAFAGAAASAVSGVRRLRAART